MKIGVIAVQGDVREHLRALERLGVEAVPVRKPVELEGLAGLIFPGGESTAIWRLLKWSGLVEPIEELHRDGIPTFGTCAGMVLLAKEIVNWPERFFGFIDIAVERNASGRQVDSFEVELEVRGIGKVPAVFIRAPYIRRVGPGVEVLAEYQGQPVMAREGNVLVVSFHPELTDDLRVYELFLKMCG
ncbi:pyridoxal 5'-phosphate synthase glutaminase subunit PdxT [Candidatus Bipolaricaulota sp. J31]